MWLTPLHKKEGITLIELLIAGVILVILFSSITAIFIGTNKSWVQNEARIQIYQNAREALDRMSREISCAFQPSSGSMQQLELTDDADGHGNDRLEFTAAINEPNGTGEYDLCKIGYQLDSANSILERYELDYGGSETGYIPWVEHITSLQFLAFDTAGSQHASWSGSNLPKAIEIQIQAQDSQQRYETPMEFKTKVYLHTH